MAKIIGLALVVLLSDAANVIGAPIVTFLFVGAIEQESVGLPSMPIGTEVRFTVPFDYGAVNTCPAGSSPLSGFYTFPGSTVSVGGISYTSAFTYLEVESPEGSCLPASPPQPPAGVTLRMLPFAGAPFFAASIDLGNSFGDTPGSIPTHLVAAGFRLDPGGREDAVGGLAPPVRVPEPSSSALAFVGVLFMFVRQMRRIRRL